MAQGLDAIEAKLQGMADFKANAERYAIDALMDDDAIALDMVFEEQLYTEGVNGYNVPIMDYQPYSPVTVEYKKMKGQPYDRVTLRDTRDFHSGAEMERVSDTEAEIISTDSKSEKLQSKYGKEILWLKPDNMDELREHYIKPSLQQKLNEI